MVTCPNLHLENGHGHLEGIALQLRETFRSTSEAHWEIFVNGEKAASREEIKERPFYGDTYLPRKFKIAVSHPRDNCVDVFAQDVGLIPGEHPDFGAGFTLLVGGGLGRSYANADTFARLAEPLTFVTNEEVEEVIAAIIATYRNLGDRTDRKRARMKYVVADLGLVVFRAEVEQRLGHNLRAPLALPEDFDADRANDRDAIDALLREHHVRLDEELGNIERHAMACPALPTCGQALTESERVLPDLVSGLEDALQRRQLGRRPLQLRLTGCPNGCARPAIAEIGVVGRTKSTYDIYLGGGTKGNRLASLFQEKVKLADIPEILGPLFDRWGSEADAEETFGDFVTRVGFS